MVGGKGYFCLLQFFFVEFKLFKIQFNFIPFFEDKAGSLSACSHYHALKLNERYFSALENQ